MTAQPGPRRESSTRVVRLPESWNRALAGLAILGGLVAVTGIVVAPERGGASVLLGVFYVLGLALAGLLFVALQNVTSAAWSVGLRRVPEAMALTMSRVALLSLAVLLLIPTLYVWSDAERVAADPLLQAKSAWLDPAFFVVRTVVCAGAWMFFAFRLVVAPRRRQRDGGNGDDSGNGNDGGNGDDRPAGASGAFLVVFAITFSIVSFDWILSLEPHWFSTVFAVYNFAGLFLGGVAVITFLTILLVRMGPLRGVVGPDHLHDLGKLLISFSTFWAYIWFCQYLLIWYTNIPEETSHFIARQQGAWGVLFVINLVVNWLLPFVVLLPRSAKRSENVLLAISGLLILGRWLDLYLLIEPPFHGADPQLGVWEIFPVLGALAWFALAFFRALGQARVVPVEDRGFESCHLRRASSTDSVASGGRHGMP